MIKKILVVDNNPLIVKFLQRTLEERGYTIRTAADGLAALECMESWLPDTVIIDLVMPKISGDKLYRTMRAMPHLKDVPVVILSSLAAEEQHELTRFEADAYVAKGPLKECAANILSVLDHLEKGEGRRLDGVIGLEGLQQREVTRELLAIKRHFEVIFDNMSEGIFEITNGDKIIYVNPAATYLVERAEERLLSKGFVGLFTEEQRPRLAELVRSANGNKELVQGEEVELNGRYLTLNFLRINTDAGKTVIVMAQDITEHRRAQRALYKSAAQYRNLAEHANDGICIVQDARLKYVNQQLLKMGGYHLADLLGVPVTQLVCPDSLAQVREWYDAFHAGREESMRFESRWLHRDGTPIEVECNVGTTEYEGRRAALVVVRDISERKRAERELHRAHTFLQSVIDGMSESIMVIGSDYRIMMMNKTARTHYGCEAGGEGEFCYLVKRNRSGPCPREEFPCPIQEVLVSCQPFKCPSVERLTREGMGSITLEIYATPIVDEEGGVVGVIVVGRDISQRIQEEHERQQLEAKLFLRQKEESISTLAGGIAHDFNNILTSVLGYAELLHRSPSIPEPEQGLARNVVEAVRRMVRLTRQMETYIRRGKQQPLEMAPNDLLREVLVLACKEKRSGITVVEDLAPDLWPVEGDPSQLSQALLNILTNGIEAMGQEAGTLTVRTVNEHHDAELECQGHVRLAAGAYVHVAICDTGPGIPPDTIERIFEPYFSTKFIGRGLGLAATLGIIRNHHGGLRVESGATGTVFHLYLPRYGCEEKCAGA